VKDRRGDGQMVYLVVTIYERATALKDRRGDGQMVYLVVTIY
jgi:hypothetical protein